MSADPIVSESTSEVTPPPVAPEPEQKTEQNTPPPEPEPKQAPAEKPTVYKTTVLLTDGKELVIEKLKAGPYYIAQKHYAEWLSCIQKVVFEYQQSSGFSKEDPKKFLLPNGEPDTKKIEMALLKASAKNRGTDTAKLLQGVDEPSLIRKSFIASGLNIEVKELDQLYYPEDLDILFDGILKVNDLMGNLKKSVSLMGEVMKNTL